MNRTALSLIVALPLALMPACEGHDHTEGDRVHAGDAIDRPTVAVTRWTERSELFMEYPVLVAAEGGRFAIHVTDLRDFSPLTSGEAVVALRGADGAVIEFHGGPSRPGIFGADVVVERPGVYDMTVRIDSPDLQDLHEIGPVSVHAAGAPLEALEEPEGESISFLKEQQWTLEFGTEPVEARTLQSSIDVPGVVRPRAGGEAVVAAPVPGRISADSAAPVRGARVRADAVLARIVPRSDELRDAAGLRAALVEAEQDHELAMQERDRAARLVDARAVPARRLAEAESARVSSSARLDAARQRWALHEALSQSGGGVSGEASFAVRAPFTGVVADARFAPGMSVEEGEFLVLLVDSDRVDVVGAVPESQSSMLESVAAGEVLRDGKVPVSLGAPIAIGDIVEPSSRTVEVRFAFENSERPRLQVGQNVGLRLLLGDEQVQPAVPESSVVDDGGRPVVFVQTAGESFERRAVRLGSREGGYVHVLEGIEAGERVVHRGPYLLRLAAMSTQIPAHGHVH